MNETSPLLLNGAIKLKGLGVVNKVASQLIEKGVEKTTRLSTLHKKYTELPVTESPHSFLQATLKSLSVDYKTEKSEVQNIPAEGACVIVANHPFGGLEGIIMADLLLGIRPDVKIIANEFLSRVSEISELFIDVDPFGGKKSIKKNHKSVKEAYEWVKTGGLLVVFPAGEVSHLQLRKRMITDPEWKTLIGRIVQRQKVPVVPMRFHGKNSKTFQLAGLLHPRLRTLMLPSEMLNKRNQTIKMHIGELIEYKSMSKMSSEEVVRYLRLQTYLLGNKNRRNKPNDLCATDEQKVCDLPVAKEQSTGLLEQQIKALSTDQLLTTASDMSVYIATTEQVPNVIQEIGRLREITFRQVGEGTGKVIDLDIYDNYYQHLFIWDDKEKLIVGSYRLGKTDEIMQKYGKKGLYSHTLFKYKKELLKEINPALELGRSFVRPEYQKSYAPLMLLWKGIGQFVLQNPEYHILFGAVSISDDYAPLSQKVLVEYLKVNRYSPELAKFVKPRNKFKYKGDKAFQNIGITEITDLDLLSDLIMRVEGEKKGVPILLKQYLKLGGYLLGFNVDEHFNNVLDGLIVVDLKQSDEKVLGRYMGKQQAATYLAKDFAKKVS